MINLQASQLFVLPLPITFSHFFLKEQKNIPFTNNAKGIVTLFLYYQFFLKLQVITSRKLPTILIQKWPPEVCCNFSLMLFDLPLSVRKLFLLT